MIFPQLYGIKYIHGIQKIFKHINMTNTGVVRGVIVIVVGNGHGDVSSNPGRN